MLLLIIYHAYDCKMTKENDLKLPKFIDLINKSVHSSDDADIGDMEAVNSHFIVVKRGFINVHYYYIPVIQVEGWDGHVIWLKISEEIVKVEYERNIEPDPSRYYVRDFAYYPSDYQPINYNLIMPVIPSKYIAPNYRNYDKEFSNIVKCDLCQLQFNSGNELSNHLENKHS